MSKNDAHRRGILKSSTNIRLLLFNKYISPSTKAVLGEDRPEVLTVCTNQRKL